MRQTSPCEPFRERDVKLKHDADTFTVTAYKAVATLHPAEKQQWSTSKKYFSALTHSARHTVIANFH